MQVAADPALPHLLPALNQLREPWISAFFNPTKEQHLSQLEHALKNPTLTGNLYLSPTSTIPSEGTTPDITFIFAPSFSTGATTVGFDVSHRKALVPLELSSSMRTVSRAFRDDATGIFLSITHLPIHTEIALSRLTPSGRAISLITLTNAAYEQLVDHRGSTSTLSALQTLYSGIISTFHAEDTLSPTPCSKLHPLDFVAEQRNVGCFVGGFESIAQLRAYNHGMQINSDWCFARMGMGLTRDGALVRGMRDWALQQAIMGCHTRVPGLCLPGLEMIEDEVMEGVHKERVDRTPTVGEFGADDVVKLLAGLDDHFNYALVDSGALALMNETDDQEVPMLKNSLEDFDIAEDGALSKSSITSAITETPPQTKVMQDGVSTIPQEGHFPFPQLRNNPTAECSTPEPIAPPNSANTAHVIEHILPRRVVPIAPAKANLTDRTFVSESQRKEERRKARNRASALRSNEKKRLYLKKLKEDIAAIGKREEVLRERERLLRRENRELRVALKH